MTALPQPLTLAARLETGLLFLLGMAVFLSKPLIYLAIILLTGLMLLRMATDPGYRSALWRQRVFWWSVALFGLGLLAVGIGSPYAEDVGWIGKKTLILLLVGPFFLAFAQRHNRLAALLGVLSGFWIAFVLTGQMHGWHWSGARYEGATWDVGAWGLLCAMLAVLLTPLVFVVRKGWAWTAVLATTVCGALLMLAISGSKGPMLGAATGIGLYLLMQQRKALLALAVAGPLALWAAAGVWPQQIGALAQQVQSIGRVQTEATSYIRLAIWENGWAFLQQRWSEGDKALWLGHGHTGKSEQVNAFFYEDFKARATVQPGALEAMHPNVADQHNMYLDSAIANGVVWTVAVLGFLVWLSLGNPMRHSPRHHAGLASPMLACYAVIGITYAILPHFALMFFVFFMGLLKSGAYDESFI
jgi:O-antigen ligase